MCQILLGQGRLFHNMRNQYSWDRQYKIVQPRHLNGCSRQGKHLRNLRLLPLCTALL
jgi:hypothetical protein